MRYAEIQFNHTHTELKKLRKQVFNALTYWQIFHGGRKHTPGYDLGNWSG